MEYFRKTRGCRGPMKADFPFSPQHAPFAHETSKKTLIDALLQHN